jgi:hypothetical protein
MMDDRELKLSTNSVRSLDELEIPCHWSDGYIKLRSLRPQSQR